MSNSFHEHIQYSLDNLGLQAALDGNAERRRSARAAAYASLPDDPQVLRRRLHQVRENTIANLEEHLARFSAQAEANGMIIHRATDAAQAIQIVLDICKDHAAHLVAKSKSMVSEEIGLNAALEAAGLKVVETDLGEYIIQLRHERPAHIITPAVHLRRSDVARTFQDELGLPYNDDIPTMTAAARVIMRQTFLQADVGVSGVNFGVVENGALCLVTNEGNGRMVTSLPPVHIALMGIERLAPTMQDLASLLALLPRSATGQKLSVYTSLIFGPRKPDEQEGPLERHLVLVDNGRRNLLHSPLAEALYCIRCGACLNACPVFRELGGHAYVGLDGQAAPYPGPIGSVISPALFGGNEFGQLARASSLCGACKEACPVDIDLPRLLLRVRAGLVAPSSSTQTGQPPERQAPNEAPAPLHVPPPLGQGLRVFAWAAASGKRFSAAQRLAAIFSRPLADTNGWLRLPQATGWGASRDLPSPAKSAFRRRFAQIEQEVVSSTVSTAPGDLPVESHTMQRQNAAQQPQALVERFRAELLALGGDFTLCEADQIPAAILKVLAELGIDTIQTWDGARLPVGVLQELESAGTKVVHAADPQVRAGLTGAAAGVAESGTLILPGGAGRPPSASLLPEVHLALLDKADLFPDLSSAMTNIQAPQVECSSMTLISGPSRTADIEMTLTIGVHGPRQVHVICFS